MILSDFLLEIWLSISRCLDLYIYFGSLLCRFVAIVYPPPYEIASSAARVLRHGRPGRIRNMQMNERRRRCSTSALDCFAAIHGYSGIML